MRVVKEAEERKNEILDVSERLFAIKGYDNTSTNDIIKEIGIARGTLYHHFRSKEDILDAIVLRMEENLMARARKCASESGVPLLQRMTNSMLALNIEGELADEIMTQIHRPQNALLHQKLQNCLVTHVVQIFAELITEGVNAGIFQTDYPMEAAEIIMIYSNIAFDDLPEKVPEEQIKRISAFICHTERILGAEKGSLAQTILPIFGL